MTSFWKTLGTVSREKLAELGIAGTILGLIWVLGIWVWYDWMIGAYREAVPTAGNMLMFILLAWILIGLAVYLWRDPHAVRESLLSGSGSE